MNEDDIRAWLERFTRTVNERDLEGHLAMISRGVRVLGVPGFDALGYEDWERQASHELAEGILDSVSYEGLEIRLIMDHSVMFKTREIVRGSDGRLNDNVVEMLVQREDDGEWRLIQQRLLYGDEARFEDTQ